MAWVMKRVNPSHINADGIRLEILNALRKEGKEQVRLREQTTATWNRPVKHEFEISLTRMSREAKVRSYTDDKIWNYLDQGTSIRWAVMSNDFQAKTQPGRWKPGRGRGGPVIVGRRAMQARNIAPRPGIQARGWTEHLQRERRVPFQTAVILAIRKGARNMYRRQIGWM